MSLRSTASQKAPLRSWGPEAARRELSQNTVPGCARGSGDGGHPGPPEAAGRWRSWQGNMGTGRERKEGLGGATGNKTVTLIIPTLSLTDGASPAATPPSWPPSPHGFPAHRLLLVKNPVMTGVSGAEKGRGQAVMGSGLGPVGTGLGTPAPAMALQSGGKAGTLASKAQQAGA